MDKLNSFGLLLLNSINRNNGENKRSFINYVNKYKDDKEKINNSNLDPAATPNAVDIVASTGTKLLNPLPSGTAAYPLIYFNPVI